MAKNKIVDLNDYELVDTLGEHDHLKLTLQRTNEDDDPIVVYYVKKNKKNLLKDPEGAVWHRHIKIDMYGTQEEYNKLVDWWFDELMEDVELKEILNGIAKNATNLPIALPLPKVIREARKYVKSVPKSKRYSDLKRYIENRVTAVTKYWLGWSDAKRKWELSHTYTGE